MQSSIAFSPCLNGIINRYHNSKPISLNQLALRPTLQPKSLLLFPSTSRSDRIYDSKVCPLRCGISSNGFSGDERRSVRKWIEVGSEAISTAFPLWVTIGCVLGLVRPSSFNWVTPKVCTVGLSVIMLGDANISISCKQTLKSSITLCSWFNTSWVLSRGGNVALSVIMTAASTLSAVIMTPFLTAKLAGKYVAVDATGLLMSTLQVVLLPVLAGAFLVQYFQPFVKFISPLMPPMAVATAAMLSGNAIAQSSSSVLMSSGQVILASCLLHASGFFFGYILARMLGLDLSSSRTISIEVGMQNAALGVVLATKHFGDPLTTVPCAVSSVCHSIFGSILAGIWRFSVPSEIKDSEYI
ncbi:putative sodium/metabolite cotransporter bass1 [Lathyrus oleraceus]|uniref:Sodium/metabolite cotransporter bass1 n=1 Tax=Pisum sativum TaxID=3888 RepID=A0A9D4YIT2_PEA|nr:putative sodium/metabolite cotransporter bass1 [Pisum sativum]